MNGGQVVSSAVRPASKAQNYAKAYELLMKEKELRGAGLNHFMWFLCALVSNPFFFETLYIIFLFYWIRFSNVKFHSDDFIFVRSSTTPCGFLMCPHLQQIQSICLSFQIIGSISH